MKLNHPLLRDAPKEQILCFTGHRPEKLPKGENLALLKATLYHYIDEAVSKGYLYFITGLADGIDFIAAEYLFRLRETFTDIKVIGVQPCTDYEAFFQERRYNIVHLRYMKNSVNALICLPGLSSDPEIFFIRNRFMVDCSSAIIAVFSGNHSGSAQTLNYARKCGLAYCHIPAKPALMYQPTPETWPVIRNNF